MSTGDWTDPALPELLARAFERLDKDEEVDIEELCGDRPDLVETLRGAIEAQRALPTLQRASTIHDRLHGALLAGRYRLEERLGSGAMGVVYRARDEELKREVAIKVLRPALIEGEENTRRFVREAETLAAIRHPGVVTIYDRSQTDEQDPFLVIELLEGETLAQVIEWGEERFGNAVPDTTGWIAERLDSESLGEASYLRAVATWGAELASGLEAAHAKGIFHRDVKPSNIFLRTDGRPALLDFGVAAYISQASMTREGSPLGTPAYMAPESLGEEPRISPALDVYGLCSTLYHLLTFRPPYTGTFSKVLASLALKAPTSLRKLRPDLPRDLVAIIEHGMERRPADRYQSARELRDDLVAFVAYRPVSVRPLSPFARGWRHVRHSRAWQSGSVVALLFLAAWGISAGSAYRHELRAQRQWEAWRQLPVNLTINKKATRRIEDADERRRAGDLLNQVVANADEAIPARLWRAAFRLDHDDPAGAARDMRALAGELGGEYLDALAKRYEALPPTSVGIDALAMDGLPTPMTREAAFVHAYHLWRRDGDVGARPLLTDPRLDGYLPAERMKLVYLARDPVQMYSRALEVEAQAGGRTLTTANLVASALLIQKHYEDALEVLHPALEQAPNSHGMHVNAGHCLFRLGRFEEARVHQERAIELKPQLIKAHEALIRTLTFLADHESASQRIREAPFGDDEAGRARRAFLMGELAAERAFSAFQDGQESESREHAERALIRYQEARELDDSQDESDNYRVRLCRAIVSDQERPLFQAALDRVIEQHRYGQPAEFLLREFPDDLDASESAKVRLLIEQMKAALQTRH